MMSKIRPRFSLRGFLFLGILCSLPAFLFSYNHVLNMFYEYGCPLEDQGLCAYLMWHNQLNVQLPPSIGALWGCAFFPGHFSLILSATSLLSKIINVGMINFFAYYHGISHGLLALSLFFVFYRLYKLNSVFDITISFLFSIVFSFNGISVASMYYPHYEMLFIPAAILFLALLIQRQPVLALPFFIISLSIREDSGFHLLSLLFFLILIDVLQKKAVYRPYILYAVTAIVFSVVAILIQKHLRNGGVCSFTDFYVGTPPFSHLSWGLIKERILFISKNRGYFYGPVVVILLWAIMSRRVYLLFGVLAFLPWFLFNFFAISTWSSGLYFYYGIFYLLVFVWPLLSIKAASGENITQEIKREVFKGYSILILTSVLFSNSFNLKSFFLEPGVSQKHIFQRLQTSLLYDLDELGNVLVDGDVASLAPGSFTKRQVLYLRNTPVEERRKFFGYLDPKIPELQPADSILFYTRNVKEGLVPFYVLLSHLPYLYQVDGTNVFLSSNKKLSELPSFNSVLVPRFYNEDKSMQVYLSPIFKEAYYQKDVVRHQNDFEVSIKSKSGVPIYSNPIRLPKGEYCVQFVLKATRPLDPKKPLLTLDVVSQNERQIFIKKDLFYQDLGESFEKEIKICFNVKENFPHARLSIRFWHSQNAGFVIKDPKIYAVKTPTK